MSSTSSSMSTSPENEQRLSCSDEGIVFVAHVTTVHETMQAYGVMATRAVYRARNAVLLRSVRHGRRDVLFLAHGDQSVVCDSVVSV